MDLFVSWAFLGISAYGFVEILKYFHVKKNLRFLKLVYFSCAYMTYYPAAIFWVLYEFFRFYNELFVDYAYQRHHLLGKLRPYTANPRIPKKSSDYTKKFKTPKLF